MEQGDYTDLDPQADLDFEFDWTEFLDMHGDLIASASIVITCSSEVTPALEAHDVTADPTNKKHKVWLRSGTPGAVYAVTSRITTTSAPPRRNDLTGYVRVKNQ